MLKQEYEDFFSAPIQPAIAAASPQQEKPAEAQAEESKAAEPTKSNFVSLDEV